MHCMAAITFRLLILFIIALLYSGCTHVPVHTRLGIWVEPNPPPEPFVQNVNVALVLGGGGAKGLAHVGVLEILEQERIPIDLIIGTSSGAAVGALYASSSNAQYVKSLLLNLKKWDLLDICFFSSFKMFYEASGPISGYPFEKFFLDNIPQRNIEQLPIPFAAVTVDIESGKPFIIKSGPIAPAIHASAAIPPVFCPIKLYGKTLVDGGVALPVPVSVAKDYHPKLIIAVNISAPPTKGCLSSGLDLAYRSLEISYYILAQMQSTCADIVIHPNLQGFGVFDDSNNEAIYQCGLQAAKNAIPIIKEKLLALNIPLKNISIQKLPLQVN